MSFLEARLSFLRSTQNRDGGWGYFPGKQSWLEPTAYAALALHGEPAADRAWALLKSWQAADGSWRPSADVAMDHWGAALCVTLATVRGDSGPLRRGVEWLVHQSGAESALVNRLRARMGLLNVGRDLSLKGWPWKPNTTSWVEPSAHSLVALKKAVSKQMSGRGLQDRIALGEAQLLDVRCHDGGWNMGASAALGVDLPSYPETTALALFGLQGRSGLGRSFDVARRMAGETTSPLARAWLLIAFRVHGLPVSEVPGGEPSSDILLSAVEALGALEGNHELLKVGGAA